MRLHHGTRYSFKYEELSWWQRFLSGFKVGIVITVYRGPQDYVKIPYSRAYTFLKNWNVYEVDDSKTAKEA